MTAKAKPTLDEMKAAAEEAYIQAREAIARLKGRIEENILDDTRVEFNALGRHRKRHEELERQLVELRGKQGANVVRKRCPRCNGTGLIPSETCEYCADCQDTCPDCKEAG